MPPKGATVERKRLKLGRALRQDRKNIEKKCRLQKNSGRYIGVDSYGESYMNSCRNKYFYHAYDLNWQPIKISEGENAKLLKVDKFVPVHGSNPRWYYVQGDRKHANEVSVGKKYIIRKKTNANPQPVQTETNHLVVLQTSAAGAARKVVSRLKRQHYPTVSGDIQTPNGVRFYLLQRAVLNTKSDNQLQVTRWYDYSGYFREDHQNIKKKGFKVDGNSYVKLNKRFTVPFTRIGSIRSAVEYNLTLAKNNNLLRRFRFLAKLNDDEQKESLAQKLNTFVKRLPKDILALPEENQTEKKRKLLAYLRRQEKQEKKQLAEKKIVIHPELRASLKQKAIDISIIRILQNADENTTKPIRPGSTITKENFRTLAPNGSLNNKIVDAYIALLPKSETVHVFGSSFFHKLLAKNYDHKNVAKVLKKINFNEVKKLVIPVQYNRTSPRWMFFVVDFKKSSTSIKQYDSMDGGQKRTKESNLIAGMLSEHRKIGKVELLRYKSDQQPYAYNSGIITLVGIRAIVEGNKQPKLPIIDPEGKSSDINFYSRERMTVAKAIFGAEPSAKKQKKKSKAKPKPKPKPKPKAASPQKKPAVPPPIPKIPSGDRKGPDGRERKVQSEQVNPHPEPKPSSSSSSSSSQAAAAAEAENAVTKIFGGTDGGPIREGIPLLKENLRTLKPNTWLDDEVINAYIELLNVPKNMYVFNTFFVSSKIWNQTDKTEEAKLARYNLKGIQRLFKKQKINLDTVTKLILPINKNRNHWMFFTLDLDLKKQTAVLTQYDSMDGGKEWKLPIPSLKQMIEDLTGIKNIKVVVYKSSQQNDFVNCGVITLLNIRDIIQGHQPGKVPKENEYDEIRRDIAKELYINSHKLK